MKLHSLLASVAIAILTSCQTAESISLYVGSEASIKQAAKDVAHDMMGWYTGNLTGGVPGMLPDPSYWWEAGAMWGALIDYWHYTGDTSYNEVTSQALLFQSGPNWDYMTPNQTKTEGNDDQAFWGIAAMSAAELNFPDPPPTEPQWLALAQAVFNTQKERWDTSKCGGGLRWQIFSWNKGYDYKNSISNGLFFQLAARLARYTEDAIYAEWAERTWDWMMSVNLIDKDFLVYDGTHDCIVVNRQAWTYNTGAMLLGAAAMYDYTNGSEAWRPRVEGLLHATEHFFPDGIMSEIRCEPRQNCDVDQKSFKAYLSRWMAATTKFAPFTYDAVMAKLQPSAQAAVQQCSGSGAQGSSSLCGLRWIDEATWDGTSDVGQQMAALEVIQSLLVRQAKSPVTNLTGGTSMGDHSGGGRRRQSVTNEPQRVSLTGRAGAGLLTVVFVTLTCVMWWFMIVD